MPGTGIGGPSVAGRKGLGDRKARAERGGMSFFKKLRDRMFRSSDKIGEGLEALVADEGGAADALPAQAPSQG